MLGWNISVYRQEEDRLTPASAVAERGSRLAVWQAGANGLGWIDELVAADAAISLGGDGYPCRYTAPLAALSAPLDGQQPPEAHERWKSGFFYVHGPAEFHGQTVVNEAAVAECEPDEWVLIVAWDES